MRPAAAPVSMTAIGLRLLAAALSVAVIAAICVGSGGFLLHRFFYPDLVVWTRFKPTTGFVTRAGVEPWPGRGRFAAPAITFRYRVDGIDYTGGRFRITTEREGPIDDVRALLERYPVGSSQPAWFNPADPATAVLSRRASVAGLFGAALFLAGLLAPPVLWRVARRSIR